MVYTFFYLFIQDNNEMGLFYTTPSYPGSIISLFVYKINFTFFKQNPESQLIFSTFIS